MRIKFKNIYVNLDTVEAVEIKESELRIKAYLSSGQHSFYQWDADMFTGNAAELVENAIKEENAQIKKDYINTDNAYNNAPKGKKGDKRVQPRPPVYKNVNEADIENKAKELMCELIQKVKKYLDKDCIA